MRRRPVFESVAQLRDLIHELSQKLGPDHVRVMRLKTDLSRRLEPKETTPFPASTQSADELNKDINSERGALEAAKRVAAAAELAKHAEAAAFAAGLDAAVAELRKRGAK